MIENSRYQKLVSKINILDELDKLGLKGHRSGIDQMICCPFHDSHSENMGVCLEGPNKGLARCLSANCSRRGTIYHLIAEVEGIDLEEVLGRFAQDFDLKTFSEIKKMLWGKLQNEEKQETIYYKESLLSKYVEPTGEYLDYLTGRGFTPETIAKFGILAAEQSNWKERIIIPVRDLNQKLVGVVARSIVKNIDKRLKVRKTPGSDIKKVLFGCHLLPKRTPYSFLVEGEADTITLWQAGIFCLGMGNASLSDGQKKQLSELDFDKVYLFLDRDVLGEKAKQRQREISKIVPCIIVDIKKFSKKAKDANEMTANELEALKKVKGI